MDIEKITIADRADPHIMKHGGIYYMTATIDDGTQRNLAIRASDSIFGLAEAEEYIVYDSGDRLVWAPELHNINGTVYLFFAMGKTWDSVQSCVMRHKGGNLLDPNAWDEPKEVLDMDGKPLAPNGITLDMTFFELETGRYVSWSERVISPEIGAAKLYIAEYDPSNMRPASHKVCISEPEYAWEYSHAPVNEGPYILKHGGRVFLTYSANMTCSAYAIGLLELTDKDRPLKSSSWKKSPEPILCAEDDRDRPGPGHNSFIKDESGKDILVYHWGSEGQHRTTAFRLVKWDEHDFPILK